MIFPSESLFEKRSRSLADIEKGGAPARRAFEKLLAEDPGDAVSLLGLASLSREAGDPERAASYLCRAMEAQPCLSQPYSELSHVESEIGHLDLAEGIAELSLSKLLLDRESHEKLA